MIVNYIDIPWHICVVVQSLSLARLFATHGLKPTGLLCPWDFPGNFLLQDIFLTQGSNLRLLHWQADFLPLSHQGSPWAYIFFHIFIYLFTYINIFSHIYIYIYISFHTILNTFICVNSFNLIHLLKQLLSRDYRDLERLGNLPKATQLVSGVRIWTAVLFPRPP